MTRTKLIFLSFLLLLSIVANSANSMTVEDGEANCSKMLSDKGCRIAWNFTSKPAAFYQVQFFDISKAKNGRKGVWKNKGRKFYDQLGTTQNFHSQAGMYRVAACESDLKEFCTYSTILWIPDLTAKDQLPNQVMIPDGSGAFFPADIFTSAEGHQAQIQYNIYTMIKATHLLEQPFPKMSEGIHPLDSTHSSIAHIIRDNVVMQYELLTEELGSNSGG